MKNLLFMILLVCATGAFAQKKKRSIPPPPVIMEAPPKIQKPYVDEEEDETKCFVYTHKEEKDRIVFVTENLLEYGWNNAMARMIITTYDYDPVAQKEAEKEGYIIAQSKQLQFIDGHFKITNDTFTFTPTNTNEFKTEIFKISFEGKTKKIKQLKNSDNQLFEKGTCLEPTISM